MDKTRKPKGTPRWLTDLRMQVVALRKERYQLETNLLNPPEMTAGTINTQYRTCGKANCKCMNKKNPVKHGPYHYRVEPSGKKILQTYLKDESLIRKLKNYQRYYHWQLAYKKTQQEILDRFQEIRDKQSDA